MDPRPLMSFKSHIDGKNADVVIYADRLEWARAGGLSMTRQTNGLATGGLSLVGSGVRKGGGAEMLPIKAMSSVTTQKDGLRFYRVVVTVAGNVIAFRCDKGEAEQAKTLLTQLILGTHPAQSAGRLKGSRPRRRLRPPPRPLRAATSPTSWSSWLACATRGS